MSLNTIGIYDDIYAYTTTSNTNNECIDNKDNKYIDNTLMNFCSLLTMSAVSSGSGEFRKEKYYGRWSPMDTCDIGNVITTGIPWVDEIVTW